MYWFLYDNGLRHERVKNSCYLMVSNIHSKPLKHKLQLHNKDNIFCIVLKGSYILKRLWTFESAHSKYSRYKTQRYLYGLYLKILLKKPETKWLTYQVVKGKENVQWIESCQKCGKFPGAALWNSMGENWIHSFLIYLYG